MSDSSNKILKDFTYVLEKHLKEMAEEGSYDEIKARLLEIHRATLFLVEVQENTMYDCGLTPQEIEANKKVLNIAKDIVDSNDPANKINMPGGDA